MDAALGLLRLERLDRHRRRLLEDPRHHRLECDLGHHQGRAHRLGDQRLPGDPVHPHQPDRYAITNTGIGAVGTADRSFFAVAAGRTSLDNSTNAYGALAMWPGYHGGIHFAGYPNLNLAASYGYRNDAALGVGGSQSVTGAAVLSAVALASGSTLSLDSAVNARTPTSSSISGTAWYSHADNLRIGAMSDTIGTYTYPWTATSASWSSSTPRPPPASAARSRSTWPASGARRSRPRHRRSARQPQGTRRPPCPGRRPPGTAVRPSPATRSPPPPVG
jgi:hypothetical protein